jgi:hypothetical protein
MIKKIVSAAALSLLAVAGVQAKPLNLSLDGFCNTFALNNTDANVYGTRSGCGYTVVDGGVIGKVDGVKYTIANDTNDGTLLFTWMFTKAVGGSGTWLLYGSDGSSTTLFNSGTYTVTTEAVSKAGTKDATGR